MNEPFSAMPPETYGAFTTSTYAGWKRCVLRADSVSAVRNGALGPPSTSSSQPRTEVGSLHPLGVVGFSSEQAATTSATASSRRFIARIIQQNPMKRIVPLLAI